MWTLWFVPGEKMSLGTAALLECEPGGGGSAVPSATGGAVAVRNPASNANVEGLGSDQDEKSQKRTRWPLIALGILIVIAAIGATVYWYLTKDQESTDDAYTDGRAVMISPH